MYAAERPDSGKTLEGLQQPEKTIVKQDNKAPQVDVQKDKPAKPLEQSGPAIMIKNIKITGQTLIPEEKLLLLVKDELGKKLTIAEMQQLADKITEYFQREGYIVAKAFLPAQDIKKGVLEIVIIPGKYDNIKITNKAGLSDEVIKMELGAVKSGAYIEKKALERAIWMLRDVSGKDVKAALAPGQKQGTADLILKLMAREKRVSGSISADNYGNRFTGKNQLSFQTGISQLSKWGDYLAITGLTAGNGLVNGAVTYSVPFLTQGGQLDVGYSRVNYQLGEIYSDFSGTANVYNVAYNYKLLRSKQGNLSGVIGYSHKKLNDEFGDTSIAKKSSDLWTIGLNGDSSDGILGGGYSTYELNATMGKLRIDQEEAPSNTEGSFNKWNLNVVRQQYVKERLSLMLSVNMQKSGENLDSSEKMSLGGAYGVRAYPKGEASGDEGYMFTGELRWILPQAENAKGFWQLASFFDMGSVNQWDDSRDSRTLKGTGLSITRNVPGNYLFRFTYAWKVGSESATSDTDYKERCWLLAAKYF